MNGFVGGGIGRDARRRGAVREQGRRASAIWTAGGALAEIRSMRLRADVLLIPDRVAVHCLKTISTGTLLSAERGRSFDDQRQMELDSR